MNAEQAEIVYILRCLCACLVGQGLLDADDFREKLELYARAWANKYGGESFALAEVIEAMKFQAEQKRDVDSRLAASLGVAPTADGARN
jgi:hypothetical protein